MDLRRQISILRSWAVLLVAATVLAAVVAFVVSGFLPRVYESQARLIVGQSLSAPDPSLDEINVAQRLSRAYAEVALSRPILDRVLRRSGVDEASEALASSIDVEAPRDSSLLTIRVRSEDPDDAATIANLLAEELIAASPAIQGRNSGVYEFLDRDLEAIQTQIEEAQAEIDRLVALPERTEDQERRLDTLQGRLTTLRATYANLLALSVGALTNQLSVLEPAIPATVPAAPQPLFNAALAGIVGLLVAVATAFLIEHLDETFKRAEQVESELGVATLGAIRRIRGREGIYRLVMLLYPRSASAEEFRTLRTNVMFAEVSSELRTLLVTSAAPREGKTTVASNLALAFAQAGRRTILVDADLRRPAVHKLFKLESTRGLTDLVRHELLPAFEVAQSTEEANLRVVATGTLPPNPAEIINSDRMLSVIQRLSDEAELVVFDSPPLQAVTDAALLAARVDGTLLVIQAHKTRRSIVKRGHEALGRVGARVIGAVLNGVPASAVEAYDYYGDYSAAREARPGERALPGAASAAPRSSDGRLR